MTDRVSPLRPARLPLPAEVRVTHASFNVRDLERTARFYTHVLGLDEVAGSPDGLWIGVGDEPFLELVSSPTSGPAAESHSAGAGSDRPGNRDRGIGPTAGLFHLAILYPTRADLAAVTQRLIGLGAPLQGASDHGVSEAIYLADPEGNGLELYRDREQARWPVEDGVLSMHTLALDVPGLLAEAPDANAWRTPPGTRIGHIHLRVCDVSESEAFYRDVIGLDLMQRYGKEASFLATGGYHHHLGINSWGPAARTARPEAPGLGWFRMGEVDPEDRQALTERLRAQQLPHTVEGDALLTVDPSGIEVRF